MACGDLQGNILYELLELCPSDGAFFADADFHQHANFCSGVNVCCNHPVTVHFHPLVVSRDQVDPAVLAKEKEIATEQVKNKPPQAIAKIVEGKLEKFYQTYCLVDQGFVKKDSEVSVKEHVASVAKELGDEISIRRFVRFQVGEAAAS